MKQMVLSPKYINEQLNDIQFSIPIYQRLFAWEEEQIQTLLRDLLYGYLTRPDANYYIGMLTGMPVESTKRVDLVDGQQRFTVMMLMGVVFRHFYNAWDGFLKMNDVLRLCFPARPSDEEFINSKVNFPISNKIIDVQKDLSNNNADAYVNSYMQNGIETISSFLMHIEEEKNAYDESKTVSIEEYVKYVYEHMAFFVQTLPSDYSGRYLNQYFESMNGTGRNLEQHEILKVDLLKKVSGEKYDTLNTLWNKVSDMRRNIYPSTNDYKEYTDGIAAIKNKTFVTLQAGENETEAMSIIDAIKENKGKTKDERSQTETNQFSFLTFTDFLLQVLYIYLDSKKTFDNSGKKFVAQTFFSPDRLRLTFKDFLDNKDIEDFISFMFECRVILDWMVLRIDRDGGYSLLSASATEKKSKLEQYQAMLFASSSRFTYYQWVSTILRFVRSNGDDEKALLDELKKRDNAIHQLPKLEDLMFETINRYFFRRLDYYIWERVVDGDLSIDNELKVLVENFSFHQYSSIEHFHPRTDDGQTEIWDKKDKDCFGNLALISQSFNSQQGNDYLSLKNARIVEHIEKHHIESLKLLMMYIASDCDLNRWNKDILKQHQNEMYKILEESYK